MVFKFLGIVGVIILGDGKVVVIVDVIELINLVIGK